MNRVVLVLAVALAMFFGLVGTAQGVANENANCVGNNRSRFGPRLGRELGETISGLAQEEEGLGHRLSLAARTDCGHGHP